MTEDTTKPAEPGSVDVVVDEPQTVSCGDWEKKKDGRYRVTCQCGKVKSLDQPGQWTCPSCKTLCVVG